MKKLALLLAALVPLTLAPLGLGSTSAAATTASSATSADSTPRLQRQGRFLVDQYGRVVIIHGLNMVWKRAPYAPPDTPAGFTVKDAAWLAKYGFNGARLGMLWAGVTPEEPGVADPAYFRRVDRVTRLLADKKIWMLFDGHQDQWHEQYGGEGVPGWAAKRPQPFALAPYVKVPFPQGYWTPEVSTVFDNFWANKDDLQTAWAAAWKLVAQHYRNQPYSMGYDLMNEPWAGIEWPSCLTTGCESTYSRELQPAMTRGLREVREADGKNIVWWEPQQFAGGQKLETYFTAVAGEKNLGFSWHNYCPDVFFESQGIPGGDTENCRAYTADRENHAIDQAGRMNAAAVMTEWGATDNVKAIGIDADGADDAEMGWMYWAYKHWEDPTTADDAQGLFEDDADLSTVKMDKLRQLVRTYPQATAGTPTGIEYDATTGLFSMTYTPNRAITQPTQVFVSPLTSPRGYDVKVTGGTATKSGSIVLVNATSSSPVTVRITPKV
ncbi:MAG: cellulase family glycosylhydrolase [Marmoricola sp.]